MFPDTLREIEERSRGGKEDTEPGGFKSFDESGRWISRVPSVYTDVPEFLRFFSPTAET